MSTIRAASRRFVHVEQRLWQPPTSMSFGGGCRSSRTPTSTSTTAAAAAARRWIGSSTNQTGAAVRSSSRSSSNSSNSSFMGTTTSAMLIVTGAATLCAVSSSSSTTEPHKTFLAAPQIPTSGDIISAGTPVKEKATGILFPPLCNGFFLVGTGVRLKWGLVKVYAVGTYVDTLALSAVKNSTSEAIEAALLDPYYPRTIRLVMNRNLSIETYTKAIIEALEPRMHSKDLDKLREFENMNPKVDLVQGAEIEMTIRGDTFLYKDAMGGVGSIRSEVFTRALCDVYYGKDPVSPTHKQAVLEGIPKL